MRWGHVWYFQSQVKVRIDPQAFIDEARKVFRKRARAFTKALRVANNQNPDSIGDESSAVTEGEEI